MAQKEYTASYATSDYSQTGTAKVFTLSNGEGFVKCVEGNIPPYSIINSAIWAFSFKRDGSSLSSYNTDYTWRTLDAAGNTISDLGGKNDAITTSYTLFSKDFTSYFCSGNSDAGKINNDLCDRIAFRVSGTLSRKYTISSNRRVEYVITLPTINAGISGNGTIECEGSSYSVGGITKDIDIGTEFTCTAVADIGWVFVGWRLDGIIVDTNATKTFTTAQLKKTNTVYVAVFEPKPITVTVTAEPVEGGTATGGGIYESGSTVTATAIPNEGYVFSHWLINGVNFGNSNPISGALTADTAVVAVFEKVQSSKLHFGADKAKAMFDEQKSKARSVWYGTERIL